MFVQIINCFFPWRWTHSLHQFLQIVQDILLFQKNVLLPASYVKHSNYERMNWKTRQFFVELWSSVNVDITNNSQIPFWLVRINMQHLFHFVPFHSLTPIYCYWFECSSSSPPTSTFRLVLSIFIRNDETLCNLSDILVVNCLKLIDINWSSDNGEWIFASSFTIL